MENPRESEKLDAPRWRLARVAATVVVLCAGAMMATSPGLPMTWDEGNAILRARGIRCWTQQAFAGHEGDSPSPWSRESIAHYWRYTTQIEGHPALYGIVIAAGGGAADAATNPLNGWRLGPMLLFSLACGALYYRMAREHSTAAALGATAALLLLPRMFAHAHFASFDGPLVSCWILAWAAFAPARRSWLGTLAFGIAMGMTLSTKATGWLAPIPFVVWAGVYRDGKAARALLIGLPLALLTFFLLNPPLWHAPLAGGRTFFEMNIERGPFNISTQFLGQMYNRDFPLPWYNTLVYTAITVPVGTLFLMLVGMASVLRHPRVQRNGMLLVANAAVLLIVRATPFAPPHDGVRLFLPSFAFLACLAGIGCASILARAAQTCQPPQGPQKPRKIGGARAAAIGGLLLLFAGSASSLYWYAPHWLSYYNLNIGGLPGATAAGMEPTYYWDGLDATLLAWLDQHTSEGEKVEFGAPSTENLLLMQQWRTLPVETRAEAPGVYRWYVLQHRPSAWQPADRWLLDHAKPAFRKTIGRRGCGAWRLDIPLVEVYPHSAYVEGWVETSAR